MNATKQAAIRAAVLQKHGGRCAFEGCTFTTFLEVAEIRSQQPGGPRFDPAQPRNVGISNFIVLCPSHHRVIDSDPHRFSAEILERLRLGQVVSGEAIPTSLVSPLVQSASGLREALEVWDTRPAVTDESFWHTLFERVPELLAAAVPGDLVQFRSKSYMGGKSLDNVGGKIVDFVYATRPAANVTLVEVKTPDAPIVGGAYRSMFAPGRDVMGGIMQLLGYRDELCKSFYMLVGNTKDRFEVFNPKSILVVGDLETQALTEIERRSFELFRNSLMGINILTFDELFRSVRDLVNIAPPRE